MPYNARFPSIAPPRKAKAPSPLALCRRTPQTGGGQVLRSASGQCSQWMDGEDRHLLIGGPANGGPLEKEIFGERFSLYSWTGNANDAPQVLIPDLQPYTTRPEGVDLIQIAGQWRIIFVEDRYRATGYGTRNAIHWPLSILEQVP